MSAEPDCGPWARQSIDAVAETVLLLARDRRRQRGGDGPVVVAVDGRSGSGKSTLASELATAFGSTGVVHTDDLAWNEGFFTWHRLLVDGVLDPLARGGDPSYRPPAWVQHGRDGAIHVDPGADVVVVEGVGSSARAVRSHLDAAVWVQSDPGAARERGLARDVALGRSERDAALFWDEWGAAEDAFLEDDRPWERADLVVLGTTWGRRTRGVWPVATTGGRGATTRLAAP